MDDEVDSLPARANVVWSKEDDLTLRDLITRGARLPEIAQHMGRTFDAIRSRAAKLDMVLRTTMRPWRALNRHGNGR